MDFEIKGLALTDEERQALTFARIETPRDLLLISSLPKRTLNIHFGPEISLIIRSLVKRANLRRIKGIGPIYAELLDTSGVGSIKELRSRKPESLMFKLKQEVPQSEARRSPNLTQITTWIESAKSLPSLEEMRESEVAAIDEPEARPSKRYVNLYFTADSEDRNRLDCRKTLKSSHTYYLHLDIGFLSKRTIIRRARHIEEAVSIFFDRKKKLDLEVALFSTDFQLDRRTPKGFWTSRGDLILPRKGPAWAPDGKFFLLFKVQTPSNPGQALLRVCIYYKNNLLQSLAVNAQITSEEKEVDQGHWAEVDYTLTADFAQVEQFPARPLNIFVNRSNDGTHSIGLKGKDPELIRLNESEMRNAVERFRDVMDKVAFDNQIYRFDQTNRAKTDDQIHQDLKYMAKVGRLLWSALVTGNKTLSQQLQLLLREPEVIQISAIDLNAVFPWALVYDKPVDTRAEKTKACLLWREKRDQHQNLDATSCERECPHKDRSQDPPIHNRKDLVCPYGFWGFRHVLEHPLSTKEETDMAMEVERATEGMPLLLLGYQEERLSKPQDQLRHRQEHQKELGKFMTVMPQSSKEELKKKMEATSLRLVYFYTHCRHEKHTEPGWEPYLELGETKKEKLVPTDLLYWSKIKETWSRTRPLVFINACHSLDFTPGSLANFLRNFAYLNVSGVIGTEISIAEPLAGEFALSFFSRLIKSQKVGEVFRQVRGGLLKKNNPLGLIYNPYCSARLRMI